MKTARLFVRLFFVSLAKLSVAIRLYRATLIYFVSSFWPCLFLHNDYGRRKIAASAYFYYSPTFGSASFTGPAICCVFAVICLNSTAFCIEYSSSLITPRNCIFHMFRK